MWALRLTDQEKSRPEYQLEWQKIYLSRVLIHHVEAGFVLRLPVYPISNGLPQELGCDDPKQINLDGLLNEDHVVLTHS